MFSYDPKRDEYIEVDFDEFSDSDDDTDGSTNPSDPVKVLEPLLVLKRQTRKKQQYRSSFINYFHLSRIVRKSGRLNIFKIKLHHKYLSYIRDLGNTLLTLRWRWILLTLCIVNFATFVIFSWLWMLMSKISGDFDSFNTTETTCMVNTHSFTGYLLFSIETMTTIGYGYRYPTEHCQCGWLLLMFQSLINMVFQGALVSAVYIKTSKPFMKSSSLFSKRAVICLRDGKLCFIFRIHDFSKKIWCGTTISLFFIDKEQACLDTDFEMQQMTIESHGLLIFPLEIEHIIDENSPLWKFRPLEILHGRFEIVAVAEGSSTITGQVSQNRTSYSNSDIMWGHRFEPCVTYNESKKSYVVDFKKFKQVIPFDTPLCSAKRLTEVQHRVQKHSENENIYDNITNIKNNESRIPKVFRKLFHEESTQDFQLFK